MATDSQTIGKQFVLWLVLALVLGAALYVTLHLMVGSSDTAAEAPCAGRDGAASDCCTAPPDGAISWHYFACLDEGGLVRFRNLGDLDWYLGQEQVLPIITALRDRSSRIETLQLELASRARGLRHISTNDTLLRQLEDQIGSGHYQSAIKSLAELEHRVTANGERAARVDPVRDGVMELVRLRDRQRGDVHHLNPPLASSFFWTSPALSMVEVLFWALFGVLTNLLVNSVEFLRKGNFRPEERWVALTKVVYGPILAMVLVLAILFGWFDLGPYEARVWTLPLIGFIFGYASRRTATLFGKLQDKVMGAAADSIEAGPEAIAKRRREAYEALLAAARPKTVADLKVRAREVLRAHLDSLAAGPTQERPK